MKNLRKVLALVTMLTMLLSVAVSAGTLYPDVADDASYVQAVETLNALEIMVGDEKGNFNPDASITRAEAAAVVVRLKNLGDAANAAGATVFTDVPADHWAAGYVNFAQQSGIINGYGDGTFGPSDPVTYEQIVKMIVAALGYTPEAEAKGGYPSGYMMVASQNDITKGVGVKVGAEAPRAAVARAAYNALEVPMMAQSEFSNTGEAKYEVTSDTLLDDYLHVEKVEGIVTNTVLTNGTPEDDAWIKIDGGDELLVGKTNAVAYLGYAVEAYVAEDEESGDLVVKGITKKSFNDELVIDHTMFSDLDGTTLKYFASASALNDTEVELALTGKIYNGRAYATAVDDFLADLDADVANTFGTLKLVSNDKDDDYEYAFLTQASYNDVIEEVNAEALTLTGKAGLANAIDIEDENVITMFFKADGTVAEFADIKAGDVLTVYASNDGALQEVYISDAKVEGSVEEIIPGEDGDDTYVIGGKEYRIAYADGAFAASVNNGDEGTFFINAEGKIVSKKATAAAGAYAYLYKADYIKDIDGAAVQMKVLTSEGKWELLTTAAKVTAVVDGVVSASNVFAAKPASGSPAAVIDAFDPLFTTSVTDAGVYSVSISADGTNRLFQYATDANGYINKLYIIDANSGQYDDSIFSLDYDYTAGKTFKASANKMGNVYFADETIVFSVPSAAPADEDEVTVTKVSALFQDAESYEVEVYDVVDEVPSIAVAYDATSAIVEGTNLFVVTKVSSTTGENNENLVKLYGYQNGAEVSGTYDVADVTLLEADGTTDAVSIEAGDVIIFSLNGEGLINNAQVLMDNATALATTAFGDGVEIGADNTANDIFGFVAERKNTRITLADGWAAGSNILVDDESNNIAIALNGTFSVYEVNLNRANPTVTVSSIAKITANNRAGADGSWVYIRMYDGAIVDVVVYKLENA
ncbi:MAG: S-layer homology domain-containing protein [Clostridia bacterium]|nr:S-layer homology domain-containing protein [Clostridia bacterium]